MSLATTTKTTTAAIGLIAHADTGRNLSPGQLAELIRVSETIISRIIFRDVRSRESGSTPVLATSSPARRTDLIRLNYSNPVDSSWVVFLSDAAGNAAGVIAAIAAMVTESRARRVAKAARELRRPSEVTSEALVAERVQAERTRHLVNLVSVIPLTQPADKGQGKTGWARVDADLSRTRGLRVGTVEDSRKWQDELKSLRHLLDLNGVGHLQQLLDADSVVAHAMCVAIAAELSLEMVSEAEALAWAPPR